MKKVTYCKGGGYKKLMHLLLEDKEVECSICKQLFERFKFSRDDFGKKVEESLADNLNKEPQDPERGAEHEQAEQAEEDEDVMVGSLIPKSQRKKRVENQDAEITEWMKNFEPHIKLLPPGSYGKKVPYQCALCTTPSWPEGRVGECDEYRLGSIKYFIGKHVLNETHKRKLRQHDGEVEPEFQDEVRTCSGFVVEQDFEGNTLRNYNEEVAMWAKMTNLNEHARHNYTQNASEGTWKIQSSKCMKEYKASPGSDTPACQKCVELAGRKGIIRHIIRFMIKYWGAQYLSNKLFQGKAAVDELMRRIKETNFYKEYHARVTPVLDLDVQKLQQYIRASFLHDSKCTPALADFIACVVKPSLMVNTAAIPDQLADIAGRFATILAGGQASEQDMVDVKLAASCISGRLSGHPLIQGVTLQLQRRLEKLDRGIESMRGRRSKETSLERSLIADAGLQLSIAAGNNRLAREFGMSRDSHRIRFETLSEHSLPIPALAVCYPEVLQENFRLIDQRFIRAQNFPKRSLFLLGLAVFECLHVFVQFDHFVFQQHCATMFGDH